MKQGSNGKGRLRGRNPQAMNNNNTKGRGPSRNQVYDSNGPGIRVRGNAHQVVEKYQALARDAAAQGDRVLMENYLQHAEHYYRIILAINAANPQLAQRPPRLDQNNALSDGEDFDDLEDGDDDAAEIDFPGEAQVYEAGQAYQQIQNAEQGQREQGQREQGFRDQGGRDQGGRDQGGRDQGGRDQGGRERNGRDQNRDQNRDYNQRPNNRDPNNRDPNQRDPSQRQNTPRDPNAPRFQGGRDGQGRDGQGREGQNRLPVQRDQAPPPSYAAGGETGVGEIDGVMADGFVGAMDMPPPHALPLHDGTEPRDMPDGGDGVPFGDRPRRRSRSQRARDNQQRDSVADEQALELARILAESGETNLLQPPRFEVPVVETAAPPVEPPMTPQPEVAAVTEQPEGPRELVVETVKRGRKRRVIAAPDAGDVTADLLEAASVAE